MSKVNIYHDEDANAELLKGKTVAVIGYGAQGRAQARMMHQAGVNIVVGCRESGASWNKAQEDGLRVATITDAAQEADIIHILLPDEVQKEVYEGQIKDQMEAGNILCFSHGFSIVFDRIVPEANHGVIMVAPKAPGTEEYKRYQEGFGVPALISVHQDTPNGDAKDIALAMAKAMKFTKAGVMECTFAQEAYEDLFGEQAVLCGGVTALIKAGYEVLTEEGYPGELAYFECLHELKLIVDLLYEGGMERMWEVVSNTAEYGGHTRGSRIITPAVKEEMRKILKEVEDGTFAKQWIAEVEENKMANLLEMRRKEGEHDIEKVGEKIRNLFEK